MKRRLFVLSEKSRAVDKETDGRCGGVKAVYLVGVSPMALPCKELPRGE